MIPGSGNSYSSVINIDNISCLIVGNYKVDYYAENASGLFSNQVSASFYVKNTQNVAPVVSNLIAPSTIQVPVSGVNSAVLSVFVNDTNGKCDINSVFFNSYRPDGTITGGSPFSMFDDGNIPLHGDTVASDGRYSLIIGIPSTQTTFGYFKFIYQARDNSGFLSNQLIDSINVFP
ncbi:MAG TPA: hypothetical protein PKD83_06095 [Ignavibacteria bacterium]|nr:hypothetical protein [Ignavibacteria bacterium]